MRVWPYCSFISFVIIVLSYDYESVVGIITISTTYLSVPFLDIMLMKISAIVKEVQYEQKAVIEFLTREGEKPKKINECLKMVYCEDVFDVSTVRYWAHEPPKHVKITGPRSS